MTKPARYVWFVLGFNVMVILLGALVRATGSGAGCGRSWPACEGTLLPELQGATAFEFAHRAASGIALLMVAVLVLWVWRVTPKGHAARIGAGLSGIAIVGEALIGAMIVLAEWVADDTSVARVVSVPLHLVNTLFLLGALTLTAFWLGRGSRLSLTRNRRAGYAVIAGGLALALLAATGAVTALADTLFPKGAGGTIGTGHFLTRLRIVHPLLAVVAASIGWWVSARTGYLRTVAARALFAVVALMMLSGLLNVALGVPVWMQLVHLGLADILWISYVWVSAQSLQLSPTTEPRLSPRR